MLNSKKGEIQIEWPWLLLAIGVGMLVFFVAVVYGSPNHANENYTCSKTYQYRNAVVCESSNFMSGGIEKQLLVGGGASGNRIVVYPDDPFKQLVIQHEYCHVQQNLENRNPDELECYWRMWFA